MTYSADISRTNPASFMFLIDQSASMKAALAGQPNQRKMDAAADSVNRCLDAITQRCSQGDDIRDYFHIAIIGYTTNRLGKAQLHSMLDGTTPQTPYLPISAVADLADVQERTVKEPDGAGGLVDAVRRFPVWVEPQAHHGTPMRNAFSNAAAALRAWTTAYPDSFPPIIINISDGVPSDGDPDTEVADCMSFATNDGPTLIYNIHLSETNTTPLQYPADESELPDPHAAMLFRISSALPQTHIDLAHSLEIPVPQNAKGYVFNANMESLVQFLDIGTRGVPNLH